MKRFFIRFLLLLAETRPCIRRFVPCLNRTFRSSSTETLADLLKLTDKQPQAFD